MAMPTTTAPAAPWSLAMLSHVQSGRAYAGKIKWPGYYPAFFDHTLHTVLLAGVFSGRRGLFGLGCFLSLGGLGLG